MAGRKNCERCGKELVDGIRFHGHCRDCWCSRLQELRGFYRPYEERLRAVLEKEGIHADPGTMSGLDETGKPLEKVRRVKTSLSHLWDSSDYIEYALWLFHARDALFAFPDNGIGLRYIIPSADIGFMDQVKSLIRAGDDRVLAAVSDGSHVYALCEDGNIYHTNPLLSGPIPVSSRLELHREVWHTFFSDEQLREGAARLSDPQSDIICVGLHKYFDPAQKMFFWVCAYGNYDHGYDVGYYRAEKGPIIERLLHDGLIHTWEECRRGEIPLEAKLELVEEAPEDMEYVPQKDFGLGTIYM